MENLKAIMLDPKRTSTHGQLTHAFLAFQTKTFLANKKGELG
jgi:hypothetical protein